MLLAFFIASWVFAKPTVTYVGGSRKDSAAGVAVTRNGTAYLAGSFSSFDFQGQPRQGADWMIYVARVSTSGEILSWRSMGGSFQNFASAVALDEAGDVVIVGSTASKDFPVYGRRVQKAFGGARSVLGSGDAFAVKLSPDLRHVIWATFVGGPADESALCVLLDRDGDVWLGGYSDAAGFVAKLDGKSGELQRKCDLPESVKAMSWDRDRKRLLLAGGQGKGFVAELDGRTKHIPFLPRALSVDLEGRIWVGGKDRFLRLDASLRQTEFSNSLRGSFEVDGISTCPSGDVVAVGTAHSTDYPVTPDAVQKTKFDNDVPFLTIFANNRVKYSTFLGSGLATKPEHITHRNQRAQAVVCSERLYVAGGADDLLLGLGRKPGGTDGFLLQFSGTSVKNEKKD